MNADLKDLGFICVYLRSSAAKEVPPDAYKIAPPKLRSGA
jgi:hypothetical protein